MSRTRTLPETSASPIGQERLRRVKDAAQYLRDRYGFGSTSTLNKLRCSGGGPIFMKIGRRIVAYPTDGLDSWAIGLMREQRSTAENHK
jgi:hypothetical protein